jgi:hypothetical protein
MSLLDHPDTPALLADAILSSDPARTCQGWLIACLTRDRPRFRPAAPRAQATLVIRGVFSSLQPKTHVPIAVRAGVPRCIGHASDTGPGHTRPGPGWSPPTGCSSATSGRCTVMHIASRPIPPWRPSKSSVGTLSVDASTPLTRNRTPPPGVRDDVATVGGVRAGHWALPAGAVQRQPRGLRRPCPAA